MADNKKKPIYEKKTGVIIRLRESAAEEVIKPEDC